MPSLARRDALRVAGADDHAGARFAALGRRQITLTHPARTENDEVNPTMAHALRPIPEKGFQVLRVIYNETKDPVTVVTAYFDNEVKD